MPMLRRMTTTTAPGAVLLVRVLVGWVLVSEGVQKFLFPELLGVGRFTRIGIPAPGVMAPFVGAVEIAGGALLLVGLMTRLAAIPLLINMAVAVLSTKVPILLGHGYWIFNLPKNPRYGFWGAASEARTDVSMLLGLLFLLIVGAGAWSFDAHLAGPAARAAPRGR
jgi:putative oxidoreductase